MLLQTPRMFAVQSSYKLFAETKEHVVIVAVAISGPGCKVYWKTAPRFFTKQLVVRENGSSSVASCDSFSQPKKPSRKCFVLRFVAEANLAETVLQSTYLVYRSCSLNLFQPRDFVQKCAIVRFIQQWNKTTLDIVWAAIPAIPATSRKGISSATT